jgi:hypothetical protein
MTDRDHEGAAFWHPGLGILGRMTERTLHGIGGILASCHAMPLLLANITFHVNYLVE